MEKKIQLNDKQLAFLKALTTEEQTLAEISAKTGIELKSGTVNSLIKRGLATHGADRVIVCELCGHKHKVKTYLVTEKTAETLAA